MIATAAMLVLLQAIGIMFDPPPSRFTVHDRLLHGSDSARQCVDPIAPRIGRAASAARVRVIGSERPHGRVRARYVDEL
ncbi:MAG TPA: hypothetical protein VF516_32960 [Kofleriaceae bacterium]